MAKGTYIRFRLSEREKELLEFAAAEYDTTMSDFIRQMAVTAAAGLYRMKQQGGDLSDVTKALDNSLTRMTTTQKAQLDLFELEGQQIIAGPLQTYSDET